MDRMPPSSILYKRERLADLFYHDNIFMKLTRFDMGGNVDLPIFF